VVENADQDEAAVSGASITIETVVDFAAEPAEGTFEVTDGAEQLGCASGALVETGGNDGIQNAFSCDDGAREGTFALVWTIVDGADGPGDVNGPWMVGDASGDYTGLIGEGDWSGTSDGPTGFGTFVGSIDYP